MEKITVILNAARDLFAEKGFDHTPVSEIAKLAGVAGGTIIYHFKNKENLLFILIRQILYSMYRSTQDEMASARTGKAAVEAYVRSFFAFLRNRKREYKVLLKTAPFEIINTESHPNADVKVIFNRYLELLEEAIKRGMDDGSVAAGNHAVKARIIYAMLSGAGALVINFDDDIDALEHEAVSTTLAGLG